MHIWHSQLDYSSQIRYTGVLSKNIPNMVWVADFTMQDFYYCSLQTQKYDGQEKNIFKNREVKESPKIIQEASSCAVYMSCHSDAVGIWFYPHCNFALDSCRSDWLYCAVKVVSGHRSQISCQNQTSWTFTRMKSGDWNSNKKAWTPRKIKSLV